MQFKFSITNFMVLRNDIRKLFLLILFMHDCSSEGFYSHNEKNFINKSWYNIYFLLKINVPGNLRSCYDEQVAGFLCFDSMTP